MGKRLECVCVYVCNFDHLPMDICWCGQQQQHTIESWSEDWREIFVVVLAFVFVVFVCRIVTFNISYRYVCV